MHGTAPRSCDSHIDDRGRLVIPEGITGLPPCFLEGNTLLKKVKFPSGLRSIGPRAFSCCLNLDEVCLPDSLVFFGEHAFSSCGLRQLVIPAGVATVSANAFSGCEHLAQVTLLEGVRRIESQAFADCGFPDMAIKIDLPSSVISIADDAFDRERCAPAMKPVYLCAPPGSFAQQWALEHEGALLKAWG